MKLKSFLFFLLCINIVVFAQGTSGSNAKFESRSLIDLPTAGILEKGFVGISMDFMPAGVLVSKIEVGLERIQLRNILRRFEYYRIRKSKHV